MNLAVHLRPKQNLNWYTLSARTLTAIALLTFLYCVTRIALMVPDPALSDDALTSGGIRVDTKAYERVSEYRQDTTTRSSIAVPTFRDPL